MAEPQGITHDTEPPANAQESALRGSIPDHTAFPCTLHGEWTPQSVPPDVHNGPVVETKERQLDVKDPCPLDVNGQDLGLKASSLKQDVDAKDIDVSHTLSEELIASRQHVPFGAEKCPAPIDQSTDAETGTMSDELSSEVTSDAVQNSGISEIQDGRDWDKVQKIRESLAVRFIFSEAECTYIEFMLDQMAIYAGGGEFFAPYTVDATELRTKYFFGYGYTYGWGQRGREAVLPPGCVDPIPQWIEQLVIQPLVERGVCPNGWINSAVVNDYRSGGCIVAHVDPPQLFERPILSCSFFEPGHLVFGASFDPERTLAPLHKQYLPRGSVLKMQGFSANEVTHGMRPEDMTGSRRVSIVLRRIREDAPRVYRETPLDDAQRSSLIRTVQGRWCDLTSQYIYVVQSLRVLVYRVHGDAGPSSAKEVKLTATWDLTPTKFGLACNGTFLDENGVEQESLFWRKRHDIKSAHNLKDGVTWTRISEELSSCLDRCSKNGGGV